MSRLLAREPVAVLGVLQALLAIAIAFGMTLTVEQEGLILAGSAAILALLARAYVTPVASPNLAALQIPVPAPVLIPDPGPIPEPEVVPPDPGPYPAAYPPMPPSADS
jgi:hypothetical protein